MRNAHAIALIGVLALAGCHRGADDRVVALSQRLAALEARLAGLEAPAPEPWDDGCLTRSSEAALTARMFKVLDELTLGRARANAPSDDPYACVSDLMRLNRPAVARAQDTYRRGAAGGAAAGASAGPAPAAVADPKAEHLWDRHWETRTEVEHGCWDSTNKRWETDPVHRPEWSRRRCKTWCRSDPCAWKAKGPARSVHSGKPSFMALLEGADMKLGDPLTCWALDVRLRGAGQDFALDCRSLGPRGIEVILPPAVGAATGPLAVVGLGDLVRLQDYGRIESRGPTGPWTLSDVALDGVSIAERSTCCASPDSLVAGDP